MRMRVIAGDLRGIFLNGPKTQEITRPILARVKKSLFDILMPIFREKPVNFLDLFSGTGAVGIEALSRNAKEVFFIERDKEMRECILENLKHCKIEHKAKVFCTDVFDFFETYHGEGFDIIFAAPPYNANISNEILSAFSESKVYKRDSSFILQRSSREKINDENELLKKIRTKIYGDTVLDFFELK